MSSIRVQQLAISARLSHTHSVAVTRNRCGTHENINFLSVTVHARESKNAVVAIIGVQPKEPARLMADLMERRLRRVEVIEITHQFLQACMLVTEDHAAAVV